MQNEVGAENYGFYFALFNFSLILNIMLDVGITNFNNRNIAQNHQLISKHFSSLFVLKSTLSSLYFIICIGVAFIIGWGWFELKLLLVLMLNQFLASMILYLRSNISGLQFFRTDSIISVLDRTLMILICGLLLWGNFTGDTFRIEWFVYAQTASYFITAVIAFLIVISKCDFIKFHYDRTFFIAILKQSLPFALLIMLMAIYNRIDPVMIERLSDNGEEQSGIYAQGFRMLDAAINFAYLFPVLLLPMFSKMLRQKESIVQMVKLSSLLLLTPAIIIALCCIWYSGEIMQLFYKEHAEVSAPIFSYLIICFFSVSITYIFGTLLTANGNLKLLNITAASGIAINIILNVILIPKYGAKGAAITSLCTQSATALAQLIIAKSIFRFSINYRLIGALLLEILVVSGTGYLAKKYIGNWYAGISLMIFIGFVFAFAIRIISIKSIYHIIKNEA